MTLLKQNSHKRKVFFWVLFFSLIITLFAVSKYFFHITKQEMANPLPLFSEEDKLKNTFNLVGFEIKELGIFDTYYEATLSSRLVVVIGKDQDFSSQVASLQFILNRSKIEGKIPTKIDLRFDKPVLKY